MKGRGKGIKGGRRGEEGGKGGGESVRTRASETEIRGSSISKLFVLLFSV